MKDFDRPAQPNAAIEANLREPATAAEWSTGRLGELVNSCLGKMLDARKNTGTLRPYLGNSNVRWGCFELSDLSLMRIEDHEDERYGTRNGDLIICEGGEPGRCAIWKAQIPDMKIQKALHRVRPRKGLSTHFLYYWFLLAGRTGALEPYFTGTTIKHLTGKALKELEVSVPPLNDQHTIAHILGTLDDKIELNRRRNQTLEAMARALFKDWFVDFGPVRAKMEGRDPYLPSDIWQLFADHLDDEGKPDGWEVQPLSELLTIIGGGTPKTDVKLEEAIADWYQLCRYLGLALSTKIGKQVAVSLSRKHRNDPAARLDDHLACLIGTNTLSEAFSIPNAAGNVLLDADFARRTISLSMKLESPGDLVRPTAAVNWLTRQLRKASPKDVRIGCSWPRKTPDTSLSLEEAIADPSDMVPDGIIDLPTKLEVKRVVDLAGRFRGAKTVIEDIESAFTSFYRDIGQHLSPWTPPPPKYKNRPKGPEGADQGELNKQPLDIEGDRNGHKPPKQPVGP